MCTEISILHEVANVFCGLGVRDDDPRCTGV